MIACTCHEEPLEPDERAWLQEDGDILCDDGHRDALAEDPTGRFEHGTPYKARVLEGLSYPKGHPLRFALLYGRSAGEMLDSDPRD